jgi:hypothetical protein
MNILMGSIHAYSRMKAFVDQAFNRIAVRIFLTEKFNMEDRMVF